MKKINITFSFRDETGDYSVKVFPFVIKMHSVSDRGI